MSFKSIVAIAILIFFADSLFAETSDSPFRQPRFEVKKTANIVYGQGLIKLPTPGSKELLLDLYEPQGKDLPPLRPAMVVIHGGGFKGGSRGAGNMASLCSELASRGFVCVSIDYRMQGDDPETDGSTLMERSIRAAVQDAGKALDWMVNKADGLHVDTKRIAIGGGSAGAITSLLLTYSKGARSQRSPVAAVIDLWGSLYRSSGDIERGDPPVLIIHGVNDNIVPFSGAKDIVIRTKEVGVECELYAIQDAGHGVNLNKEIDGVTLLQRIVNFLDTQLKLSELSKINHLQTKADIEPAKTLDRKQPTRLTTIVTLGDSITKGVRSGVTGEQTFASLVDRQLRQNGENVRVINVGIGGERTDQALKRLDQIIQLKPDIVTIMYGTNDSYVDKGKTESRLTVDEFRQNLRKLAVEMLSRGIQPVLMTEPRWSDDAAVNGVGENPNKRLEPFVLACRETALQLRIPIVDHFANWSSARENGTNLREWTTDGCHPNPAGHQQLADLIVPVLKKTRGTELNVQKRLVAGESVRIVCFGDSVTGVYYHTGSQRAYSDMMSLALKKAIPQANVELFNAGRSGHTTVDALTRIDRDVLSHKPDLVTVMFGLNDMTRVPPEVYSANLKEIVTRCRAAGSEVVLATPNNVVDTTDRPSEKLIQYCDIVRQVGSELKVPVCDVYRELEAQRQLQSFDWRLLMSDAIHPNMDGHKAIAVCLAQTITGQRVTLNDVPPPPAMVHTSRLLRDGKPVNVLAMSPYDQHIATALKQVYSEADLHVETWPVANLSLAEMEQTAKARVRTMKPDLVVIAVPSSTSSPNIEAFVSSFAWIMNWSLNFGAPTWDVVVVHPSVTDGNSIRHDHDELIRQLVRAQDLNLIDRASGDKSDIFEILSKHLEQFGISEKRLR